MRKLGIWLEVGDVIRAPDGEWHVVIDTFSWAPVLFEYRTNTGHRVNLAWDEARNSEYEVLTPEELSPPCQNHSMAGSLRGGT